MPPKRGQRFGVQASSLGGLFEDETGAPPTALSTLALAPMTTREFDACVLHTGAHRLRQLLLSRDLDGQEYEMTAGELLVPRFIGQGARSHGKLVLIDHGLGVSSLYGHLSSLAVEAGQEVEKGQVLGRSGATGLAARQRAER